MATTLPPGLFEGAEHRPFLWPAGQPAALLVHGFLGTPAEMRPLAIALHDAGWTVEAPLLPGMGAGIYSLLERRSEEWRAAVAAVLVGLRTRGHAPILLVGHSLGGAIALQVAVAHPPAGLALLAPLTQLGTPIQRLIWHTLRPLLRNQRPFQHADFSDPQFRRALSGMLPGGKLDDPLFQETIRQMPIPLSLLGELKAASDGARRDAAKAPACCLLVQGDADPLVLPAHTRRLARRLPGRPPVMYLPAGHELLDTTQPAWPTVRQALLDFAGDCRAKANSTGD